MMLSFLIPETIYLAVVYLMHFPVGSFFHYYRLPCYRFPVFLFHIISIIYILCIIYIPIVKKGNIIYILY